MIELRIHHEFHDIEGHRKGEKSRLKILTSLFIGRSLKLVTIDAQNYSLGYEWPFKESKVEDRNIIINEISVCDLPQLAKINESEEFARGLLILSSGQDSVNALANYLFQVHRHSAREKADLTGLTAFCDPDGDYLYVINPNLSNEDLIAIANS